MGIFIDAHLLNAYCARLVKTTQKEVGEKGEGSRGALGKERGVLMRGV